MNLSARKLVVQLVAGIAIFLLGSFATLKLEDKPITKEIILNAKQLIV
jgi:hypothetical protein